VRLGKSKCGAIVSAGVVGCTSFAFAEAIAKRLCRSFYFFVFCRSAVCFSFLRLQPTFSGQAQKAFLTINFLRSLDYKFTKKCLTKRNALFALALC